MVPSAVPGTRGRIARRLAGAAAAVTTLATVTGCFGGGDHHSSPAPSGGSASSAVTAPLHVRSGVTRIVGELSPAARQRLGARAGGLVAAYFRAAFLHPATHAAGRALFPGFTAAAAALAERDRRVVTGAAYAGADQVTPRNGTAYVTVLAPKGHLVGATVRVSLALDVPVKGKRDRVRVRGRLLLTPTKRGWRIFGYDLSQSGLRARSTR
jgi:hypothetical protein